MKIFQLLLSFISIAFLSACNKAIVNFTSDIPGARLSGLSIDGKYVEHDTPAYWSFYAPDVSVKNCVVVKTPTVDWSDGDRIEPFDLTLCGVQSSFEFKKSSSKNRFHFQYETNSNAVKSAPTTTNFLKKEDVKISLDLFKNQCKELGFKTGSKEFGNCVLKLNEIK